MLILELLQVFLILLLFRLIRRANGIFPAVGALFRLVGAAENKMALITDKNHFNHREISIALSRRYATINSRRKERPGCSLFLPKGGIFLKRDNFWDRLGPRLPRYYVQMMTLVLLCACMAAPAFALDDMWTIARKIIVDVYDGIAGISTVLAGMMSAVAVVGAKLSNNQHKVDQAWDWLKRIWVAWAIINGIGAFIAYITPLFNGLATLTP